MSIVRSISFADTFSPVLARLSIAMDDLSEPMAEISNEWLENTRSRFLREESPLGVPWQKSKAAIEEGRSTLYESGALFNELDRDSGRDFAEVGVQATGGPAEYAAIHNFGGVIDHPGGTAYRITEHGLAKFVSNGSAQRHAMHGHGVLPRTQPHNITMPARPYIGVADEDEIMAMQVLTSHFLTIIAAGGAAA